MKELAADESENGGATRTDAALAELNEKAREELADIHSRRRLGEFREEIRGEVGRVAGRLEQS